MKSLENKINDRAFRGSVQYTLPNFIFADDTALSMCSKTFYLSNLFPLMKIKRNISEFRGFYEKFKR
jgi:hypothetical protein